MQIKLKPRMSDRDGALLVTGQMSKSKALLHLKVDLNLELISQINMHRWLELEENLDLVV